MNNESPVATCDHDATSTEVLEAPVAEKEENTTVKPTPPDPEHVEKFLKDILRKNFKARNFMLGIERSLTELMNSER